MSLNLRFLAITTAMWMSATSLASAQAVTPPPGPMLELTASGEQDAVPDIAQMRLSVDAAGHTAAQAMAGDAQRMTQVLAVLKQAGVAGRDLQTSGLSLSPQYVYEQNQSPRLTGYQASNGLIVTVRNLAQLGPVADALAGAGVTSIGQIEFAMANPQAAQDSARVVAVKALEDKAALYARATGYRIKSLIKLREGGPASISPPNPQLIGAFRAQAVATPIEAGELKVRIEVTGVFELEH